MSSDLLTPLKVEALRAAEQELPHTKIVATIGPASEGNIGAMIDLGMSVARVNFSHGSLEDHRRRIEKIRAEAAARGVPVGILGDLPGPKMRTGLFPGGWADFGEGDEVRILPGQMMAAAGEIYVDVEGLLEAVEPGHRVFLADGQVEVIATGSDSHAVTGVVRRAGRIADRKGVHMPDSDVHYELPTTEDRGFIEFAVEQGVDMLGLSFVGHAREVEIVRELAPNLMMVAKIERTVALANLDEILAATDGVMVARGDLGVELELEQLPIAQKSLIQAALRAGKFTITATEMLESMISSSRPTRAEVTDVANAVLDGTDAVMLSAETAVGHYPVETIATAARISRAVEHSQRYLDLPRRDFRDSEPDFSNALAMAAVQVTEALGLQRIVCFTETGNTVRLISRYRPNAEILAICPRQSTINCMTPLAGVRPVLARREPRLEDMLHLAAEMLEARGMVSAGEEIVFVAGVPAGVARSTNLIKLHRVGEEVKLS